MARSKNRKCESCLSMIKVNDVSIKCKNMACKKTWHSSCAEKTFNVDLNDIVSSFRWTCPECRGSRCKQKLEEITEKNLRGAEVWAEDKVSGDNQSDISNLDSKVLLTMLVADQKDSQKVLLVLTTLMKELLQEKSQMKNLCEENEELRKAMITHLLQDKLQLKQICDENETLKKKILEMNERMQKIERNVKKVDQSHEDLLSTEDSQDNLPQVESSQISELSSRNPSTPFNNDKIKQVESARNVYLEKQDEPRNLERAVCAACVHVNKNPSNDKNEVPTAKVFKSDDSVLPETISKDASEKEDKPSDEMTQGVEITTNKFTRYEKYEHPAVFPNNATAYDSVESDKVSVNPVVRSPSSTIKKVSDGNKRIEICVGRIAKGTPVDVITKYILRRIPKTKFSCDVMNPNGFYATFKVSVDPDYKDKLLSNAFWPPNVIVRRLYPRK